MPPDTNESGRPIVLFDLKDIQAVSGVSYAVRCPDQIPMGDDASAPRRSSLLLLEDGAHLGQPHAEHAFIAAQGSGAYSHWGNYLYFSSRDNSDPRTNGRLYQAIWTAAEMYPHVEAAQVILQQLPPKFSEDQAYAAVENILATLYPIARMGETKKLFWHDAQALADYRRLIGSNMRSFERKIVVFNVVRALKHIAGDLAECGAYEGATAFFMAKADAEAGRMRPLHLFDSFQGLPAPIPLDGKHWHQGDLSASEHKLHANLAGFGQVRVYKGWIPARFNEIASRTFAFVHLDVDLYEPTKASLEFFYARVARNGIILCDDSGFTTCPGANRAMRDFFADKSETIISLPTGQDMIIKQ